MRFVTWNQPGIHYDDVNLYWSVEGAYLLEPGDPGYVADPTSASFPKPKNQTKRKYRMSNPTPGPIPLLIAAGEDLCDGLDTHAVALGIKQNTAAVTRADLEALKLKQNAFKTGHDAIIAAYTALRLADSNAKGFIARCIKVFIPTLGDTYGEEWVPTGLPGPGLSPPRTQDERFTALDGLRAYLVANPSMEVTTPKLTVTAALATTLHTAYSTARNGLASAISGNAEAEIQRDGADAAFRLRYRAVINELEGGLLGDDDPDWYDFGLNRPADPSTPGVPGDVSAAAIGGARVLAQAGFSRRANSLNFYKKVVGVDAEPVKVTNTEGNQFTIEGLPVGATVEITVTGVNDAGEGVASDPVSVNDSQNGLRSAQEYGSMIVISSSVATCTRQSSGR